MDLSSLKPCDLWTSLCHPMPGLMQKGLGRQRDAQPSRYHLTALIYCTHGANLPFFDRLKYTLTSELTLVSIFSQAGRFFFLILSAANLDSESIPRLFVVLKG